jgi:hypothetical protein
VAKFYYYKPTSTGRDSLIKKKKNGCNKYVRKNVNRHASIGGGDSGEK